jgi:protocatechuate 3,4-dioxygenase beta subunit
MRFVLSVAFGLAASQTQPTPPPNKPAAATPRPSPVAAKPSPKPTPVPPPVLTGTVRGPDGKPVEGAVILYKSLGAPGREPAAMTKTDAEGRFRADLRTAGPVYVRVSAKGLAGRAFEKVPPGSPLAVTLERGQTIQGLVRDSAGDPLARAVVVASPSLGVALSGWDAGAQSIETKTDARGAFRLEGVGAGLYSLRATARGFGSAYKSDVRPGATVNLMARPGGWLAGRVIDPKGLPVRGALVRAEKEPQFWGSSPVEATDAEGRFELAGLEPGTYSVVARHADFAPGIVTGIAVDVEGRADLSIGLTVGAAVTGRLVDSEERPLSGRVAAQELAGQPMARGLIELLRTEVGADGRFRIERFPPGSYALGILAPRFAGRRVEAEVSGADPVVDLGDIALEQGLAIRGRVRSSGGGPIADAEIATGGFDMMRGGVMVDARSGADGSFVLAGVLPGATQVNVRASGYASVNNKTMTAGEEPVDVILTPGGSITGLVVEEDGRPIDAYRIVGSAARSKPWEGRIDKSVGSADGRFLLEDLSEDTYVLQVFVPDRAPATVPGVRVVAGRTGDAGTIRVPRGGVVRGTVVDTSGDPVIGATVKAYGATQEMMEWRDTLQTVSEPSGSFEIKGVPEGRRQIVATHPDYAVGDALVDVVAGKGPVETRLVMTQGGRIEGVARKRDGTPLAGLEVSVYSSGRTRGGGARPNPITRSDGSFTAEHVAPGQTYVNLMANAGLGRMISMMSKQVEVREGETTSVELLSREILVNGHVTKSGTPLPGLRLRFMGEGGMTMSMGGGFDSVAAAPTGPQRHVGTTGEDGTFALIVDTPGRYWVQTESVDGRTNYPSRELQIPDAETHTVEIAFSGVPVTGVVIDKETDQPVKQAFVRAIPKDKDKAASGGGSTRTGADGRFQFDVDPGEYTFTAGAEGYGVKNDTLTVGSTGLADARIELEKGLEIKGRVLDASGQPVPSLTVIVRSAAAEPDTPGGQTLPDGTFRIAGLAAKPYNLCTGTELAGYAVRMGVSPGGGDVTMTLRPAAKVRLLIKGPDGAPMAKAWPNVTKLGGAPIGVPWMGGRAPSDSAGIAEMSTPAGGLEIEVWSPTYKGKTTVSVAEGATVTAEVTLTEPIPKSN